MLGLWGADETLLSECGEACNDLDDFFFDYLIWLADTYSGDLDIVMTAFANDPTKAAEFGIGTDAWQAHIELVDAEVLRDAGLYHFYSLGEGHAMTGNGMYTPRVAGQSFAGWLTKVLAGELLHLRGAH